MGKQLRFLHLEKVVVRKGAEVGVTAPPHPTFYRGVGGGAAHLPKVGVKTARQAEQKTGRLRTTGFQNLTKNSRASQERGSRGRFSGPAPWFLLSERGGEGVEMRPGRPVCLAPALVMQGSHVKHYLILLIYLQISRRHVKKRRCVSAMSASGPGWCTARVIRPGGGAIRARSQCRSAPPQKIPALARGLDTSDRRSNPPLHRRIAQ